MADLKALADKDPEFFKYLQENDAELLNFDKNTTSGGGGDVDMSDDDDDEEEEEDDESTTTKGKGKAKESKRDRKKQQAKKKDQVLTKELLKTWQKNILEVRARAFCGRCATRKKRT